MKTKFTLFVTVLAAASFWGACASVSNKPPLPHAVKFEGHWYAYLPDFLNWTEAKKHCESLGGHLVIIESKEENDFVFDLVTRHHSIQSETLWIGATKEDGKMKWVDGRQISTIYFNWQQGAALSREDVDYGLMYLKSQSKDSRIKKWQVTGNDFFGDGMTFVCEWE